jgi:vancomycin resistance protein VanW
MTDIDSGQIYEVLNGKTLYYRRNNKVFEEVDVKQKIILCATGTCVSEKLLYRNKCEIGYPLPDKTEVVEKG